MKLTDRETKIARLALDKGAKNGERQAAAIKLIESLYARGVSVEELDNTPVIETVYRDRPVYQEPPVENAWTRFVDNLLITLKLAPVCLVAFAVLASISITLAGKPASPREPVVRREPTPPAATPTPSIESANAAAAVATPTPSIESTNAAAAVATPTPSIESTNELPTPPEPTPKSGNDWYKLPTPTPTPKIESATPQVRRATRVNFWGSEDGYWGYH